MEPHHECAIGEIQQDEFLTFRLPIILIYITPALHGEFVFQWVSEINPE